MEMGIKNRRALVTGGARGIGEAIAFDLAKEGAKVVVTSRNKADLDKVLERMGGRKAGHEAFVVDLTVDGEPEKLIKKIEKKFGLLDIVVNNIGDTLGRTDHFAGKKDWKDVYRLNLEVGVEINNLVIPGMRERKWGRIVNVTAGAALENSGPVPYCSMKAAMTTYTRSTGRILAMLGGDVVMSALLPGVVITKGGHWDTVMKERPEHAQKYLKDRCPLGRFGKPEEISPMAVLLCSERATFCHGGIYLVDAGQAKHYVNIDGL